MASEETVTPDGASDGGIPLAEAIEAVGTLPVAERLGALSALHDRVAGALDEPTAPRPPTPPAATSPGAG